MTYNLPDRVLREIRKYADLCNIELVILFGSRARGTNTERSDVDLAVRGGDFDRFYFKIKESIHSLLSFDIVNLNENISRELEEQLHKDGVVIYEKT